jgi:deazaflavin-dependent oxidoreductase (nitroreductase family)
MRQINRRVIEQFRAGGPVEGMHRERLLLLTTKGRRSGAEHTTPMMFVPDGDRLLVIASNAGAPADPDWYLNVVQEPRVVVEVGDERFEATATPATGETYDRLWSMIKERFPFFAEHEEKAGRTIPVVVLTRSSPR